MTDMGAWMKTALADLRHRADELRDEVERLQTQLDRVSKDHARAVKALEALEALRSEAPSHSSDAVQPPHSDQPRVSPGLELPDQNVSERNERPRQRVRSPELVAKAVADLGGPTDRNRLYLFMQTNGRIPQGWAKPRNAFTTALSRAIDRGLLVKDGDLVSLPSNANEPPDDLPTWRT